MKTKTLEDTMKSQDKTILENRQYMNELQRKIEQYKQQLASLQNKIMVHHGDNNYQHYFLYLLIFHNNHQIHQKNKIIKIIITMILQHASNNQYYILNQILVNIQNIYKML
eukprot:UN10931